MEMKNVGSRECTRWKARRSLFSVFLSLSLRVQEPQDVRDADLHYQEKQRKLNAPQISQGVFPLFNSF